MVYCFLLDGMLGSLARWLRIIGYDTLYYTDKEDDDLKKEAQDTGRILLTRDNELYKQARKQGLEALLIHSEKSVDQLREMVKALDLNVVPSTTRCPRCNGVLKSVEKDEIEENVPKESFRVFNDFWVCVDCSSVYWRGSHWIQIEETLDRL